MIHDTQFQATCTDDITKIDPTKPIIILVPGTWYKFGFQIFKRNKTYWFSAGKQFQNDLIQKIAISQNEYQFYTFKWPGDNSIFQRNNYSINLANDIDYILSHNPANRIAILAHSHGGNLVARAVSRCKNRVSNVGICYMATPFIEIFPRRLMTGERFVTAVTVASAMVALIGLSLLSIKLLFGRISADRAEALYFLSDKLAAAAILCGWIYYFFINTKKRQRLNKKVVRSSRRIKLHADGEKVLILRSIDDEANLAIAAGAFANFFSNKVIYLVATAAFIWYYVGDDLATRWYNTDKILSMKPEDKAAADAYFYYHLVLGPKIATFLFFALGVAAFVSIIGRATYGKELIYYPPGIQMNLQSVPDVYSNCRIITLLRAKSRFAFGLRHSIYKHPNAPGVIARWINNIFADRPKS